MDSRVLAAEMTAQQPGTPDELTRLLSEAKRGDVSAFEQIMLRHERQVLRTALHLLGRMEDAQDAAQEVFLRVYKHLRRFDERRDFAPWLYRIAVNVCRDIARKRGREATLDESARAVQSADSAQAEQRRMLMRALQELPAKERAALVLRDLEGLTTAEVATILGSSESTVRSQISTARVKIRKFIDRNFGSRT
jgi:RNA polymerase sigma-70 factor (ECF subfamily)